MRSFTRSRSAPQAVNGINYRISIYTSSVHSGAGTDVYFRPFGTGPDWYPLDMSVTPMGTNGHGFSSYIDRWLIGEGWINLPNDSR